MRSESVNPQILQYQCKWRCLSLSITTQALQQDDLEESDVESIDYGDRPHGEPHIADEGFNSDDGGKNED